MSADDNVVKIPTELTRLFADAHRAVAMGTESKQKFVESKMLLSASLAAIRAKFQDNEAFGKSCCEHGLGENVVSKDERSILIQWAERQEWTRTVLEKTERTSVRMIHLKEWTDESLRSAAKTLTNQKVTTAKREEAEASIREHKARTGSYPSVIQAGKESGLSRIVIEPALASVKAEDRMAPSELRFTKAQDAHVEARIRALRKALEAEYSERVRLQVLEENAPYRAVLEKSKREADEKSERYESLINYRKPIFNETEFATILTCLHPDNVASKEKRDTAFKAFNAMKFQLTGKK